MLRYVVLYLVAFSIPQIALAATYHVAKTDAASDSNPGTAAKPWETIGRAVKQLEAGDTAVIHGGVYREWAVPKRSGTAEAPITFQGVDRSRVVLTGADVVTGWNRVAGDRPVYRHTPWTARFQVARSKDGKPIYHHPANEKHRVIGRPEQVIVDEVLLDQVLSLDKMKAGTFFADLDAKELYVWLRDAGNPAEHDVQASTRGWVFGYHPWRKVGAADHIRLKNVTIRYAANHAQRGAGPR